tara:strand:+ start:2534 stop:4450 length:1917 start_codon:yes stop_codon:yes gene_type:complete
MKSISLKKLSVFGLVTVATMSSFNAKAEEERTYPEVYPFVPFSTEKVQARAEYMSEDENYINNVFEAHRLGLSKGRTSEQPWMSTYWPLNKGLIADPYYESLQILRPQHELSWTSNYNKLTDRRTKVHPVIMELSQKELNKLAPSEKYDLLLGDKNFDLTNRLREYMHKWGSEKEYGFLASLDKVSGKSLEFAEKLVNEKIQVWHEGENKVFKTVEEALPYAMSRRGGLTEYFAQQMVDRGEARDVVDAFPAAFDKAVREQRNFVVKEKNDYMALWEGICHGWSTAAGNVPRPKHMVSFDLPNGKKLNFYPEDIKGLVSLLWANSEIQNTKYVYTDQNTGKEKVSGGILMEGLRCNQKSPDTDEWGRLYDSVPDYYSKKLEPRCVGVHPAIWHMGLINIIGNQGRSMIVERKVKAAVDNHPMSGYDMDFFNPMTGDYGDLADVIVPVMSDAEKARDQFKNFRNPETKYIVGVRTTMYYLAWKRPDRKETDGPEDDELVDKTMLYDLELDIDGNIIGGQWRTTEVGKKFLNLGANHDQPDFFWSVTKHFKETGYFDDKPGLSKWTDTNKLAPSDWLNEAKTWRSHNNKLYQTHLAGWGEKCEVKHKKTKEIVEVACEFIIDKPMPLTNVVNKLIELSRE